MNTPEPGSPESAVRDRQLIVVSGPGGAGKGTLVEGLVERDPTLWLSRSWTSREPRTGEAPDAYVFVDRATFDAHIDAGGFLEWVDFLDYRQGTPLPDPPPGHDVVLEIDVQGGATIVERFPDTLLIFVDTPDRDEQRARLVGRGDPPEKVEARMKHGDEERRLAATMAYTTVINDNIDDAVTAIEVLIAAARARPAASDVAHERPGS